MRTPLIIEVMAKSKRLLLIPLLLLACVPARPQTDTPKPLPVPEIDSGENGRFGWLRHPYQDRPVAPASFANSSRIDALIRAGNLYLTLNDAIALALENNLDIELQRFSPRIADTDVLRARAGGLLRGLNLSVREGPAGVGGPRSALVTGISGQQDRAVDTNLSISTQSGLATGPLPPSLDPALVGQLTWNRRTTPQTSSFLTGSNELLSRTTLGNVSLQKGFLSGGTFGVAWNNNRLNQNSARADVNPATNSSLGLTFTQPLLRGFGFALNNRFIRIAKNDRLISDLTFQQQVIATVSATVRLYWDLVSLSEDLRVRQQTLDVSNQLLTNNRQAVEAGTLAPIEVVRAQAEVARSRRDVLVSDTLVRQQETVLKDFLTRNNVFDPLIAGVRVIPTDVIRLPDTDPVEPVQDMIASAYRNRPDLRQARIQLDNSNISLKGSRSALLPELDLIANAQNNALYGQVNALPPVSVTGVPNPGLVRTPDPSFLGGFGTGLSQIFGRHFPDYGIGVQLNIPLYNRVAIADVVRDKLTVRQQEVRLRQLEKQVQVEIQNALVAVQQARATYQAALQARELQQQSLEAEQQKYQVGLSTNYTVIQAQRDLSQARSDEVLAMSDYVEARASLERALGTILDDYNISVEDAYRGVIPTKPSPLPATK